MMSFLDVRFIIATFFMARAALLPSFQKVLGE